MRKQWIVGTALLMLMTSNAWADDEPSAENILRDQFRRQYHGALKPDVITLKNLDAKGDQATWSVGDDVSPNGDFYTWAGQLADYRLLERTWARNEPVRFSAMLTNRETPVSGWSVNLCSLQTTASDHERVVDGIKADNKYPIMNSEGFNYRFDQLEPVLNIQKNLIPALEKGVKALDKQMVAAQKAANACWGKGANDKRMTREETSKKIHQQRDEFNRQNNSETFKVKYDKEVYQPAIATCYKQGEECYEASAQQKQDFDISKQRRQTFLQSQELSRKLQGDWVTLGERQYPLTVRVSEVNSKKVAVLMKIDSVNQADECWERDAGQLRRDGVIK